MNKADRVWLIPFPLVSQWMSHCDNILSLNCGEYKGGRGWAVPLFPEFSRGKGGGIFLIRESQVTLRASPASLIPQRKGWDWGPWRWATGSCPGCLHLLGPLYTSRDSVLEKENHPSKARLYHFSPPYVLIKIFTILFVLGLCCKLQLRNIL